MPVLNFSKWSPGGNTTLFFPASHLSPRCQAFLARQALDPQYLGGEQAGFTDEKERRLRMAGGEFCVNASRAFGALLAYQEVACPPRQAPLQGLKPDPTEDLPVQEYSITVSGWPEPVSLRVRGCTPLWQVAAGLRLPHVPVRALEHGMTLVRLPGISHILLDAALHPLPEAHEQAMALLRQAWQLEEEPAVGAIWWREVQGQLDMIPLVHVRDAHTTFLESACGSGALALAIHLSQAGPQQRYDILQPSGASLTVTLGREGEQCVAEVDGSVSLVAHGQIWLPDADV